MSTVTATSAPCCVANAWSNGLCASASMPRASVEAAVAARTTRPMMMAWSLPAAEAAARGAEDGAHDAGFRAATGPLTTGVSEATRPSAM